jgi:hypothetical protein
MIRLIKTEVELEEGASRNLVVVGSLERLQKWLTDNNYSYLPLRENHLVGAPLAGWECPTWTATRIHHLLIGSWTD